MKTIGSMRKVRRGGSSMARRAAMSAVPRVRTHGTRRVHIDPTLQLERALDALRREHEFVTAVIDATGALVAVTNREGRIVRFNNACERATGVSSVDAHGRDLLDLFFQPEEREAARIAHRCVVAERAVAEHEGTCVGGDGVSRKIAWSHATLLDPHGGVEFVIVTGIDVTERRREEKAKAMLQEQFLQAQKMEVVGRLASAVAHDFNNLLMVIQGRSDVLLKTGPSLGPARKQVEEIGMAAERACALARQLLLFGRRRPPDLRVIDLNEAVAGTERLFRHLVGADIEVANALAPRLGRVKADPGQIEQVIMNLVVNARDAMPNGGRLTIETANVDREATGGLPPESPPGPYVMLAVSDTGCGMTPDVLSRLYEPFFTTKAKGKGTGLGLSTVHRIVKESHGAIQVESAPGRGTQLRIYLPRVEEDLPQTARCAPITVRGGTETILLVEDEELLRDVIGEFLRVDGYQVLVARHGEEALEIAGQHPGPIHLLLTDIVMPRMGGCELAVRIRAMRPDVRVLLMSGYSDETEVHRGSLGADVPVLRKPFTHTILSRGVRDVLD